MDTFYLIIVIVLFALAISDLIVGVSNDAVNFLNSAIGSKVAPFRIIILIAAIGVLVGATFSSGMMEVARKGIFHPESFYFSEIMIIFLAVMLTDVMLLDLFNTFGLPTSTTVSIVFELLGAAVAISLVKIKHSAYTMADMGNFINTERALLIISGILLSIVIAFSVGIIIQYLTRILFTFNYKKTIKYFGSVFGGLAITAITYFILIKGAKGSSFLSDEKIEWITGNSLLIMGISFAFWAVLTQLLQWIFNFNVFKVIVLFGTFALAMAFAGNDLVNFIGVPLAGFESYKIYAAQQAMGANELAMSSLRGQVDTPTSFLIIAGLVMVITLWISKKARTVTRTEINLGNQDEVNERFASYGFARVLVRNWIQLGNFFRFILPNSFNKSLNKRLDDKAFKKQCRKDKSISFDLVRASVNLAVASSLIAFATSYKLPLSTTYVTFMVAMGTSLADRAWGRESAVYRISGVITVIGGWFVTAFVAFTSSLLMAFLISWGGKYAIAGLVVLAIGFVYKTHMVHKKREDDFKKSEEDFKLDIDINGKTIQEKCNVRVVISLIAISELYSTIVNAFISEKRKKLKNALKDVRKLNKEVKSFKKNVHETVRTLQVEESIETGDYYVQLLDYLRETAHCMNFIAQPVFEHVDNNHAPLSEAQADDLKSFSKTFSAYTDKVIKTISSGKFGNMDKLNDHMLEVLAELSKMRKTHLKRIKSDNTGTRISLLYLDILSETKNLVLYIINLAKTSRDFAEQSKVLMKNSVKA
ncbi:MAG: inorganic phosphate transporter [Bacteroidales bacterium]|nr:inorganic phosphate transporter [Bacteroidales bacterium]